MRAGLVIAIAFGAVLVASLANDLTGHAQNAEAAVGLDPDAIGTAWLGKADDGHFYAEALVAADRNAGSRVRFLVDTGATSVALTRADAARLGLDIDGLDYAVPVATANGAIRAAAVRLDRVTVSGLTLDDVDALVLEGGLTQSLLGMSYLGRLSKVEASGDALILRR